MPTAPAIHPPSGATCTRHPETPARWRCPACASRLCEACGQEKMFGRTDVVICTPCGGMAAPFEAPPAAEATGAVATLEGAFAYPLRREGLWVIGGGTVFFAAADLLSRLPLVGVVVAIFATGILTAYMFRVIGASADGRDELPDWPEFHNVVDDVLMPIARVIALWVVSFGPAVLLLIHAGPVPAIAAAVAGLVYFPMGLLAIAMRNTVVAASPHVVVPAIGRVAGDYLVTIFLFGLVVVIGFLAQGALGSLGGGLLVGLLVGLVAKAASLYLLFVQMRLLGLLYFRRRRDLGWFDEG
jgi:hypothetical protein